MDSYSILNVTRDASDREIEVAYEDLKRKYDPSFNTSIHAYKKYREILKAYEDIKDEQRRKMYELKDEVVILNKEEKKYNLYDFNTNRVVERENKIDYSRVEDLNLVSYKNIEVTVKISYLYKLLNLRYDLEYVHSVKCNECNEFVVCDTCDGLKVVEYKNNLVWCPICQGKGKVSVGCKSCGDVGYHKVSNNISFYVDEEVKEFKGLGDYYSDNLKSNLKVNFDFYDKEEIKVDGDKIEINYYLNKEETLNGIKRDYFSEQGAFKVEIDSFVENGFKKEIDFNNKKIIFTFYNKEYNGENIEKYLFINKSYKDKIIFFNDDYSVCSEEETIDCFRMIKCDSKIILEGNGEKGKYGGVNGDLVINVIFNNNSELFYCDNVRVIETSKMFNILGGKINDVYHYGFKGENSLIKRKDCYYLLKGTSDKKLKLSNYFLFKIISVIMWFVLPSLILFIPYSKKMFFIVSSILAAYFILVNILMEVEV